MFCEPTSNNESFAAYGRSLLGRMKTYDTWANGLSDEEKDQCRQLHGSLRKAYDYIRNGLQEVVEKCANGA